MIAGLIAFIALAGPVAAALIVMKPYYEAMTDEEYAEAMIKLHRYHQEIW